MMITTFQKLNVFLWLSHNFRHKLWFLFCFRVPTNGYYFFVFNSENEVQTNFLRIHFRLEKTTYNVSHAVASCKNQTHPCSLPLKFWSTDKVILELPVRANDSLWNQEFLAVSTCEPRTAIYVGCVIAVPLLIILFAFQWDTKIRITKSHAVIRLRVKSCYQWEITTIIITTSSSQLVLIIVV